MTADLKRLTAIAVSCLALTSTIWAASENCTVLPAEVKPATVPPGSFFRIKYCWQAPRSLSTAYTAFVHFKNEKGQMVFQGDHTPGVGTGTPGWTGDIAYENRVGVPLDLAEGTYKVALGLYTSKGRAELKAGEGVVDEGGSSYVVGTFTIDNDAPRPAADTEKEPSLNLEGHEMVFREEFDGPLDVSPWGSGTRWIAHTPWAGDFGDAGFADPSPGFPFLIEDGVLRIEARKRGGKWQAGLLASNDPKGNGFSLQYGYFEMRAKMPKGPGVWPAFWLCSSYDRTDPKAGESGAIEIDVIEYYGHFPNAYNSAMHVWLPAPHSGVGSTVMTKENEAVDGFHDYGVMVEPEFTTMYFDRIEVWKTPTPEVHNKPLMVLLNLALGSGWPIDKVPNPSYMYVEHVRVWSDQVATPSAEPSKGFIFSEPTEVSLSCATEGAQVYYTTDGSEPTTRSTRYRQPFRIAEPCELRAMATKRGLKPSLVGSVDFARAQAPEKPLDTVAGLKRIYYEGTWEKLPDFGQLVPAATRTVGTFEISECKLEDRFALFFDGFIEVPTDGVYTFYTNSDDGSRLFVGQKMIVDNDGLHGMRTSSGTIGLIAGKHDITLEFFEAWGGEGLEVSWSGPGFEQQPIPASALSHTAD